MTGGGGGAVRAPHNQTKPKVSKLTQLKCINSVAQTARNETEAFDDGSENIYTLQLQDTVKIEQSSIANIHVPPHQCIARSKAVPLSVQHNV